MSILENVWTESKSSRGWLGACFVFRNQPQDGLCFAC